MPTKIYQESDISKIPKNIQDDEGTYEGWTMKHAVHSRCAGTGADFERQILKHMLHTFMLWVISKGDTHGYELLKKLQDEKGLRMVSASQLYPILKDMVNEGLISKKNEMHGKRVRKVYHITSKGRQMLRDARRYLCASPLKRKFMKEMVA